MARWEIREVDKLIHETLANDAIIKTKMGISSGKARVSGYRVVRDPNYFFYIYFYCVPGPDAPGQGTYRIQTNIDYDIEVRTLGAPTDNSEDVVDRIDALIGTMVRQVTSNGLWMVSARRKSPISIAEPGENPEVFYMRRGATYMLQVVNT